MKKNWWIFLLVFSTLLLLGGIFFLIKRASPKKGGTPTPTPEGVLIETTLAERPYVTLTPRADGRELKLSISRIKNAQTIEYELVYLSRGLSRGVIGTINLSSGQTSYVKDLLLGTCSKNVCKYDEDVSEGTLTLRFRSQEGVRKFITDFHLQQADDELTSMDGNFKIEGKTSTGSYYLTMSTVGLPGEPEGTIVSGIYGVFSSSGQTLKNAQITLALTESAATASLYSWQNKAWQEEKTGFETDGESVSAIINTLTTFVAVTP